ncbi:MAG: T9SS type A sorting domain-containing protein [Bernardetiaceae bacterium]
MKRLLTLSVVLALWAGFAYGQSAALINPVSMRACGTPADTAFVEFTFPLSVSTTPVTAVQAVVRFPDGVNYVAGGNGIVNNTVFGLDDGDISIAPQVGNQGILIEIDADVEAGGVVRVQFLKQANCAVGVLNDTLYFEYEDAVEGDQTFDTVYSDYTVTAPQLQIQSINPTPARVALGQPFTRTFTIVNDNSVNASVNNFYLTDFGGTGLPMQSVVGGTLNATRDTIFVTATDFANNPGGAVPGLLEAGETYQVQITQIANNCNSLNANMEVGWKCNDVPCGTNIRDQSVLMADGNPLLEQTFERLNMPNTCQDARVRVKIKNIGQNLNNNPTDSLSAIAYDLDITLGRWRGFAIGNVLPNTPEVDVYNVPNPDPNRFKERIEIRYQINGTPIPAPLPVAPTNINQFRPGPRLDLSGLGAPLMGLQDLDGDGQFDDLAPGDSVVIDLTLSFPCLDSLCANLINNSYRGFGGYRLASYILTRDNPCKGTNDYQDSLFWHSGNGNSASTSNFVVTDNYANSPDSYSPTNTMSDGDTINVNVCLDNTRTNFFCPTDSLYLVVDELPGYTILDDIDPCTGVAAGVLQFDRSTPGRVSMYNPNFRFIRNNNNNQDSTRRLQDVCYSFDVRLNCNAPGFNANTPINYEIYYDCAGGQGCDCTRRFKCGTIDIIPNCPSVCPDAVQLLKLETERYSFGWIDYRMNQPIYPPLPQNLRCRLRLDRAMPYDTIQVKAQGVVNSTGAGYDSIYFEYSHLAAQNVFADTVRIVSVEYWDASAGASSTITLPANRIATPVGRRGVRLEFLAGQNGFPNKFEDNDLFDITMYLVVAKNDALLNFQPTAVNDLRGYTYGILNGSTHSCDTLAATLELHRPFYNGGNGLAPNGASIDNVRFTTCNSQRITTRVSVRSADFARYYPNEFRPYFGVDSVIIKTLANRFEYVPNSGRYNVANYDTLGVRRGFTQHENIASNNTPNNLPHIPSPLINTIGDTLRIRFDAANWVDSEIVEQGGNFSLSMEVRPLLCNDRLPAEDRSQTEWYLRNYAYTRHPAASGERHLAINRNGGNFTAKQPLSINLPPAKKDEAFTPFESFDIRICNDQLNTAPGSPNNGELPADSAWVQLISPSNQIQIQSITRLSNNSTLTVDNYAAGRYWTKIGRLDYNQCENFRIRYDYQTCNDDTVIVEAAWDCLYPTNPNDTRALNCNITRDTVTIDVQPAVLQASIIQNDSAWICDTLTYILRITNANLQYIKDLSVTFNPAPGMSYIANSSAIWYPAPDAQDFNNPAFYTAIPDPVGNAWNLAAIWPYPQNINTHELPGITQLDSNKIYIRLQLSLSCNYVVGTRPTFLVNGRRHCGDTISTGLIIAPQPKVRGSVLAYSSAIDINNGVAVQIDGCNQTGTATVTLRNNGPDPTKAGDFIYVGLPPGFSYENNSYNGIQNAQANGTNPVITGDTLRWEIPAGITAGNQSSFSFTLRARPAASCGTNIPIRLFATTQTGFLCPQTNTVCDVNATTAEGTGAVTHRKPDLVINFTQGVLRTDNNTFTASGTISNVSPVGISSNTTGYQQTIARFYCDNNPANGQFDPGENQLALYETNVNITNGTPHTFSFTVPANPADCPGINNEAPSVALLRARDNTASGEQCVCNNQTAARLLLLPVTWLWVNGEAEDQANLIQWRVIEDGYTDLYVIERYIESTQNWQALTQVTSRRTKDEIELYQWTHPNPLPKETYRIRSVDQTREESLSSAFVVYNQAGRSTWNVFPNPASDLLQVANLDTPTSYRIVDILGNTRKSGQIAPAAIHTITLKDLAAGQYIIILQNQQRVQHIPFIVQP